MIRQRVDGPTPSGGAYAIAYYQDDNGDPIDKDRATAVEIVEFAGDGREIARTYATMDPVDRVR